MKTYTPLHCHSHYSLLDGLSKPDQIVDRIEEIEGNACALTDHGNIAGSVSFTTAMKKRGLKPILGCELYVCSEHATVQTADNQKLTHLPILAKSLDGWKKLIQITSQANYPEHFYHKPRLSLEQIASIAGQDLIVFSGHLGSHMASVILDGSKPRDDWKKHGCKLAEWFKDTFGKDNFRLEVQRMDGKNSPLQLVVADCIREISKETGIPCIATPDAHYASKQDAIDQRILLCTNLHVTLSDAYSGKAPTLGCFFNSDNFHIPSYSEMLEYGHTEEELENTNEITSFCDNFDITKKPILPQFQCPNNASPDEYLRQLCRDGFRNKIISKGLDKASYGAQADKELKVFEEAGLSSYFLIVRDMLNFCRKKNWLLGPGRGSAAGCLVSYLIDITQINPMPYGLWFERFYNPGRNTADHISMPDIDIDVPVGKREDIISHLKTQYGTDKVSQMITYQTLKGNAALKAVLRAHGGVSFDTMNEMTNHLPEESKISGELQTMKEATGESSIIRWALENRPDKFSQWVTLNDDGVLEGPYAQRFEQAMRLEGTKSAQSRHAAGVVIGPEPLANICPMILDTKSRNMVAGLEMADLEAIGMIKFDILGVAMLDKIMGIQQILTSGEIHE